jgi:hypothetical protein
MSTDRGKKYSNIMRQMRLKRLVVVDKLCASPSKIDLQQGKADDAKSDRTQNNIGGVSHGERTSCNYHH